nr:DUF4147 domain-containing protein [Natrononativus amylolyticus]
MFRRSDHHARTPAHETALACLEAGIRAASPETAVKNRLALEGDELRIDGREYDLAAYDRIVLCGGGKAAAGAVQALESLLGDRLEEGVVVSTGEQPTSATGRIEYLPGDHPTPTTRNVTATERVLEVAECAGADTLFLAVVTGGASALWCAPAAGLSLSDLEASTEALLASGAAIDEINAVRKHCSAIKGGGLARAAAPATVVTLAVSDVVGDDPAVIGSGPTVPDSTTFADARAVVDRYALEDALPGAVLKRLEAGVAGDVSETPDGTDPAFDSGRDPDWYLLANGRTAIDAARAVAEDRGYETAVLSSRLRGEAGEVGRVHAAVAEEIAATGDPLEPPAVVLSGGEVTVTLRDGDGDDDPDYGDATGGPNQELALVAALEFRERDTDAVLASVDTDGIDGPTDACGAVVDRETVADFAASRRRLAAHDSHGALESRDALLETGYTGTNVNDLRVLVVDT